jgi:hypothetical protein
MGTTPVFSEVIGIKFNEAEFGESIQKLQTMWKEAMAEMSGSPVGGAVNTSSSAEALKSLSAQMTELGVNTQKTFAEIANQIGTTFKKATAEASEVTNESLAKQKKAYKDLVDEAALEARDDPQNAMRQVEFTASAKGYVDSGLDPKALTDKAQEQVYSGLGNTSQGVEGIIGQYEDLNAKQRQWHDDMTAAHEAEIQGMGKAVSAAEVLDEKQTQAAGKQVALAEEMDEKRTQAAGKQMSLAEEMDEKRTRSHGVAMSQAEEMDSKRTRSAGVAMSQAEEMDAKRTRSAGVLVSQAEEMDEKRTRSFGVQMSQAEEMDAKREAMAQREGMRMAAARDQAYAINDKMKEAAEAKSGGISGSFMSSFKENFSAESLGNMAGMVTAFAGIGVAIGAVTKAASELVDQFKSGFEYLSQLEMKAALLQGVIATNVKLSQDFATNYKLAGEASVTIQRSMEDASIKYGITTEILDRAFKQFADGGGLSLVHNLNEAVQVTNMLSVALQAAGKDADTSRAIMSELPKMLAGTEKPSSFILETMGLTNKQWNQMVAQARIHHDLLDRMTPLMQNYLNVAADAANRQTALTQTIALDMKRIMADGERDAFAVWKETLQQIKKFLEDNHDKIVEIVRVVSELVTNFAQFVLSVVDFGNSTQAVHLSLNGWLTIVRAISWEFKDLATYLHIAADLINLIRNPGKSPQENAERFAKIMKDADKAIKVLDAEKKLIATGAPARNTEFQYINGKPNPNWNPATGIEPGPNSKPPLDPPVPKDHTAVLSAELKDQLEGQKALYDDQVNKLNLLKAQKKLSVEEYDKQLSDAAAADALRQAEIIGGIRRKLEAMKGLTPEQRRAFNDSLDSKASSVADSESKRISSDNIRDATNGLTGQNQAEEQAIASAKRIAAARIAEAKRAESVLGVSARTTLNTIVQAEHDEKVAVDQHYDNLIRLAGADVNAVEKFTNTKAEFDAAYTVKFQENATQRVKISQEEFDKQQQESLRPLREHTEEVIAANSVKPNPHDDPNGLKAAVQSGAIASANYVLAQAEQAVAKAEFDHAKQLGILGDGLKSYKDKLDKANQGVRTSGITVNNQAQTEVDKSPEGGALSNLGSSFHEFSDSSVKFSTAFSDSVNGLSNAIDVFHTAANNLFTAFHNGGLLGGAGATSSMVGGMASSLSKSVGDSLGKVFAMAGPIAGAIGGIFSAVSSIFQQEVQETVEKVQKNIALAMSAYQNQQATLVQTLAAVQQQEASAIAKLSGQKGGSAALANLLPQLDNQIAQLQLQIKMTKINFENSLQDLTLNNTALSGVFDKWQQINTQVQAYLGAGGSVAEANQLISDSLRDIKKNAGDALNQGYQTAVGDAINLNNLIQQRLQMEQQEAQTEFGLINGDALERQGSKAIMVGTQLQQQKAQYQLQLENLNATIDLTQQKVSLEGQMFNLAMSTAQLQQTSNTLQIQQLQEQLVILQGQKAIYDGISQGANGQYGMSNTLQNQIGVVNINVTAGGTPGDDSASSPSNVADALSNVLTTWTRYGLGTSLGKS